jgi:hypothetical protein
MSDTRQCHAENHDGFSSLEPWFSGNLAPEPLTAAWWVGIMEHRSLCFHGARGSSQTWYQGQLRPRSQDVQERWKSWFSVQVGDWVHK